MELIAGGEEIQARGLDRAVPKDISKANDVMGGAVIGDGKQTAQVVGKDLFRRHTGRAGKVLHHAPDLLTAEGLPAGTPKDRACREMAGTGVAQEFLTEAVRQQDETDLALEPDLGAAVLRGFDGDGSKL